MQEFFAAKHLVDTMSHEELKTFVSDHIKKGSWKVVMQFVAGLLEQEKQSTDIFSGLLPLSIQTGINHNGLQRTANEYAEHRIYKDTFIAFESKWFS